MKSPESLLEPVVAACREAADAILEIYANDFSVHRKSDDSPLTAADLASHRILVRALAALDKHIPVLSEESAEVPFSERQHWSRLWVVDPLDGTREFIKRNGEFTVNVALVEDSRPVLGAIAVPVEKTCYTGIVGQGAARWTDYRHPEPIRTRKPAADPPVVLGSRSHGSERARAYFRQLGPHRVATRGSALKFCSVAEGSADFYPRLGATSEWDTAAGHAIVEAAGGRVVLADGREMRYNRRESLLNRDFLVSGDPQREWPTPPAPAAPE